MVEADGGEDSAPPELDASVDEPVDASGGVDEGNGDAPDAGLTPDQEACAGTCAVTTSVAACPTPLANCIRRCERQFTAGICLVTLRALLRCQMGAGPDGYDCVLGGVTPKAGVCATEKKEDDDCLSGDAGT